MGGHAFLESRKRWKSRQIIDMPMLDLDLLFESIVVVHCNLFQNPAD